MARSQRGFVKRHWYDTYVRLNSEVTRPFTSLSVADLLVAFDNGENLKIGR